MTPELRRLVELAKMLPPPSKDEKAEMELSFCWGNLALTENHRPNRKAFQTIAMDRYGWSEVRFNRWADDKEWW